jgi:hypothetical protein
VAGGVGSTGVFRFLKVLCAGTVKVFFFIIVEGSSMGNLLMKIYC